MTYNPWWIKPHEKKRNKQTRYRSDVVIKHYRRKVLRLEDDLAKLLQILTKDDHYRLNTVEAVKLLREELEYCRTHRGGDEDEGWAAKRN